MAQRHWVGGSANWDNTAGSKWSLTAGGSGGQAVPTVNDDVFLDSSSGANTVTISASAICKSLDCTGFTGTLAGSSALQVNGNITLVSGMTFSWSGELTIGNTNTCTLTSGGKSFSNTIHLNINVTLGSTFVSTGGFSIENPITFDDGGFNFKCLYLDLGSNAVTLTAGATTWEMTGYDVSNIAISFNNSGAKTLNLTAGHTFKFTNTSNTNIRYKFQVGNGYAAYTLKNVWFARGASTGNNFFDGNLTCTDIKDTGTAAHGLYFTGALFGGSYTFTTFTVSGSSGNVISIGSSDGSSISTVFSHNLICSTGTISCDYLSITRSTASGGATFYAGANSTNVANNSGWIFTGPPVGPTNLKSYDTNVKSNIKSINTNPIANIKSLNTNT